MSLKFLLLLLLTILLHQLSQLSLENCNIIHERKELGLRCKSRLKRANSRTLYYSNSIASFNIVLSGDVEKNPGPCLSSKHTKCNKTVSKNHKRLKCSTCQNMVHGKCSKQQNFQSIQAHVPQYYICGNCLFNELPLKNSNLQNLDKSIKLEDSTECQHKVIIKNNSKNLSIAHLNTQSLCSTSDEFLVFLHTYYFDIMTLSETCLKLVEKQ